MSGPRYRVPFRRRRKNLTDYYMRKAMIRSGKLHLVVRISSEYVYAQLVKCGRKGDHVMTAVCSKELEKWGWRASYSNTSAAYLSGLLLGKKALAIGIKDAILNIGLRRASSGSNVFAFLKGITDLGINIPYNSRILPSEERIRGEHIALYAKRLLEEDQPCYSRMFSRYLSKGLRPEQLPDYFEQAKSNIINDAKR